jgi:hypothetical protein
MKKTADQQQQKQELLQTDWLSMAWKFERMKTDKNKPAWKLQKN